MTALNLLCGMYVYMYVYIFVACGGQRTILDAFSQGLSTLFFETRFLINLSLPRGLEWWPASPGDLPISVPKVRVTLRCHQASFFILVLRIELKSSTKLLRLL